MVITVVVNLKEYLEKYKNKDVNKKIKACKKKTRLVCISKTTLEEYFHYMIMKLLILMFQNLKKSKKTTNEK